MRLVIHNTVELTGAAYTASVSARKADAKNISLVFLRKTEGVFLSIIGGYDPEGIIPGISVTDPDNAITGMDSLVIDVLFVSFLSALMNLKGKALTLFVGGDTEDIRVYPTTEDGQIGRGWYVKTKRIARY